MKEIKRLGRELLIGQNYQLIGGFAVNQLILHNKDPERAPFTFLNDCSINVLEQHSDEEEQVAIVANVYTRVEHKHMDQHQLKLRLPPSAF